MTLTSPYPKELLRVAKKVVWYDRPEETLGDLKTFLTHLMVYGSLADLSIAERYVPEDEFRNVLENAPAGVFTEEAWRRWHERFGLPVPSLPRRRFRDGSVGPEAGGFFGRERIFAPQQKVFCGRVEDLHISTGGGGRLSGDYRNTTHIGLRDKVAVNSAIKWPWKSTRLFKKEAIGMVVKPSAAALYRI